ncbi:MAG: hypothetical protein ACRBF0_06030 [Calditrichia bacterium]
MEKKLYSHIMNKSIFLAAFLLLGACDQKVTKTEINAADKPAKAADTEVVATPDTPTSVRSSAATTVPAAASMPSASRSPRPASPGSVSPAIVPTFHITKSNYDGNPRGEVDLGDPVNGARNWKRFLQTRYPGITDVIYVMAPRQVSGAAKKKFENAVDAARELGIRFYICINWLNYLHPEKPMMQRNDRGEYSKSKPSIYDEKNRQVLLEFTQDFVASFQPDGIILDHFRFQQRNWGFAPDFINEFSKWNKASLNFSSLVNATKSTDSDMFERWVRFREVSVTSLIKEVVDVAKNASDSKLMVGIFLVAPQEYHLREVAHNYGQFNPEMLRRAGIDVLIPMSYNTQPELSRYQTTAFMPYGFKVWGALSVDDGRFPMDQNTFRSALQHQLAICDKVVLYEDTYLEVDELNVLNSITKQSVPTAPTVARGQLFVIISESDMVSLEGQRWGTSNFSVLQKALKSGVNVQFVGLKDAITGISTETISKSKKSIVVFIRPYNFTRSEQQQLKKLMDSKINLLVINPNQYFQQFYGTKGTAKDMEIRLQGGNTELGSRLTSLFGSKTKIAKSDRYFETMMNMKSGWKVVATMAGKPVIAVRESGNQKLVLTSLTPHPQQYLTSDYSGIMNTIMTWLAE